MKKTILIAGGGIGGLSAALACLKQGFDVEVYEQAAELKEVGAGVQLSANGTRVLYALGVGEALKRLSCEVEGKQYRLWSTGEAWKLYDLGAESVARYGYPYFTVYRPDLLAVLAAGVRAIKPDAIHLGARCMGIEQDGTGVTLHLEHKALPGAGQGSAPASVRGAALIGADGVHSNIRQALFGADRPEFTGIMVWRGVIPMERLPLHLRRLVGLNWLGPGKHVVNYPLHAGRLMNFVAVTDRAGWDVESWSVRGTTAECLADYGGWHDDIQTMIGAIDAPFKWALKTRAPLARWSVGRVTLLGDACHSTLPFMAQGAVMAVEDGFILARALAAYDDLPQALRRYEAARHARTTAVVEGSAANLKRFHNPELAHAEGARAYLDREMNEAKVRERYEWLFTYDATTVPL